MLTIKNFSAHYGKTCILNNINLQIKKGISLAVIGESGAGKTTLGLSILGLSEAQVSGSIVFGDREILKAKEAEMNKIRWNGIALVPQNVDNALNPLHRIFAQVAEPIIKHGLASKREAVRKAEELLDFVGLDFRHARAYPHELSGGQKQRALIAMALSNDPDLLVLDEPTSSLDPITKREITGLLKKVCKGRTVLLITHDLSLAYSLADEAAVLYAGKIIEYGRAKKLITNPKHPYTRGLLRSFPNMTTTKDLQGIRGKMVRSLGGCVFHERCTQAIDICYRVEPPLVKSNGRLLACHRGGIMPVLRIKNLCKSFGGNKVVKNVTLTVDEGETLGLVGESGSGKSTLAHSIMGIFKIDSGKIFIDEKVIKTRDMAFYKTIQIVFQNPTESINHRLSVLEAIMEPLEIQGIGSDKGDRKEKAIQALLDVELPANDEFLNRYAHHLSGGETQRVAIARALVLEPRFIIADEPTSSLDASTQAKILKLLMKLQEEKGLSLLLITHDIALARKVCDRIAVLHRGRIIEEGASHSLIARPVHSYTKKLISAAPFF